MPRPDGRAKDEIRPTTIEVHALPYADLPAVDRFTLAQFGALLDDSTAAYDGYQFARVYQVPGWAPSCAAGSASSLMVSWLGA